MGRTSQSLIFAGAALGVMIGAAPAQAASADYFLKFDGVDGQAAKDKGHKEEIEILSFSWGATRSSDALTDGLLIIRYLNAPAASGAAGGGGGGGGAGGMGAGKVSMQDMSVMRGPRQTTSLDGSVDGAGTEKFGAVSGMHRDSAMGQATGKRQHKPIRARGYYDTGAPPAAGSLTIAGRFPGCTVGARYPGLTLAGAGKRFKLQDAIITSCARGTFQGEAAPMEEVSFNYAKIEF